MQEVFQDTRCRLELHTNYVLGSLCILPQNKNKRPNQHQTNAANCQMSTTQLSSSLAKQMALSCM